ncbi:hypothetical protein KC349_g7866 [Hortaea werneckii]|nr:hypothetical protein KC349_g7866 [Hortaea werneckii]
MDLPMPDAPPFPLLTRLQQARPAQLNTALTHKTTAQARLATASTAFRTADEANIAASTRLLDFKAGPPQKPTTSEGMTAGQIKRFQALKRAQRLAQREFERAAEEVVQAQEEVAVAGMRVRRARRALEELDV